MKIYEITDCVEIYETPAVDVWEVCEGSDSIENFETPAGGGGSGKDDWKPNTICVKSRAAKKYEALAGGEEECEITAGGGEIGDRNPRSSEEGGSGGIKNIEAPSGTGDHGIAVGEGTWIDDSKVCVEGGTDWIQKRYETPTSEDCYATANCMRVYETLAGGVRVAWGDSEKLNIKVSLNCTKGDEVPADDGGSGVECDTATGGGGTGICDTGVFCGEWHR